MTISLRAAGTPVAGTNSMSPVVPATAAVGDMSVLTVECKPYTATITDPAGWTKIGEATNGTVGQTVADTGSVKVAMYIMESATAGDTVTVTTTGTGIAAINTYRHSAFETWVTPTFTDGGDGTHGANFAATGAAGLDVIAGDWVVAGCGNNTDAGTISGVVIGGMAGATLGTTVVRTSLSTTLSFDSRIQVADIVVTAGASTAAPDFTFSCASNNSGTVMWLRLRVFTPAQAMDITTPVTAGITPDATLTYGTTIDALTAVAVSPGAMTRVYAGFLEVEATTAVSAGTTPDATLTYGTVITALTAVSVPVTPTATVLGDPLPDVPAWQINLRSAEYAQWATSHRRTTSVMVEFIDESGASLATFAGASVTSVNGIIDPRNTGAVPRYKGVAGWQVQAVATDPVRRTCKLDLTDPSFVPRPGAATDLFHPLGRRRARIWHMIWSGTQWWPILLGTFHLDAPTITGEGSMSVGGFDSVGLIKRARWVTPLSVGGKQCHRAIQQILYARAPWVRHSITPTTAVLPVNYEIGSPGDDPWDDVERIADAAGLDVYADREGNIIGDLRDRDRAVVADFSEGPGCTMVDLSRSLSLIEFANVVLVTSSSTSVEPPVSAVAKNTDEASPGFVGGGYEYVHVETSDAITTTDQARSLARYRLAEKTALAEAVSITAISNPGLDPLDLVTISKAAAGAAGTYQIQAIAWSDEATMDVELSERRVF